MPVIVLTGGRACGTFSLHGACARGRQWSFTEDGVARISVMIGAEREPEARAAIVDALAQYREPDGSYRLENEWHSLVTRAA